MECLIYSMWIMWTVVGHCVVNCNRRKHKHFSRSGLYVGNRELSLSFFFFTLNMKKFRFQLLRKRAYFLDKIIRMLCHQMSSCLRLLATYLQQQWWIVALDHTLTSLSPSLENNKLTPLFLKPLLAGTLLQTCWIT